MTDFVLIDLTSQADAVWKHIFNLSKSEILAWLSKRGTVEEIQHSFEVNSYLFRSIVDRETFFCLTPNRSLLIYLGEDNFYQPKREETSEKSLNLTLAKIYSKDNIPKIK